MGLLGSRDVYTIRKPKEFKDFVCDQCGDEFVVSEASVSYYYKTITFWSGGDVTCRMTVGF